MNDTMATEEVDVISEDESREEEECRTVATWRSWKAGKVRSLLIVRY